MAHPEIPAQVLAVGLGGSSDRKSPDVLAAQIQLLDRRLYDAEFAIVALSQRLTAVDSKLSPTTS